MKKLLLDRPDPPSRQFCHKWALFSQIYFQGGIYVCVGGGGELHTHKEEAFSLYILAVEI